MEATGSEQEILLQGTKVKGMGLGPVIFGIGLSSFRWPNVSFLVRSQPSGRDVV